MSNLIIVPQKDTRFKTPDTFRALIAAIFIWSMIGPLIILDICTYIYQEVYFSILEIPKIKRSEYLVFDRFELEKLTLVQKLGCLYCSYGNGILAWAKDVANQTETYSCAIKHNTKKKGQEHQGMYYERSEYS